MLDTANTGKFGRGLGKNAGEWTGRVEISKEEVPGSKRSIRKKGKKTNKQTNKQKSKVNSTQKDNQLGFESNVENPQEARRATLPN